MIVPGRQDVAAIISGTGSLAAQRDMPVGIPGEGGQVVRVLVEPGQWVAAGQVLAVIDRQVQAQEASQLAAQIDVARADLKLAQANLVRAQRLLAERLRFARRHRSPDGDPRRRRRPGAGRRRRISPPAAPGSAGSTCARRPPAWSSSRSVEAGQVVSAGSPPCSGSPRAARWSFAPGCRRPISPG